MHRSLIRSSRSFTVASLVVTLAACGSDGPPTDVQNDQGTIRVAVEVRGNATDATGVLFRALASDGDDVASDVASVLEAGGSLEVPPGSYEIAIEDLDDHCWSDSDTLQAEVFVDGSVDVSFDVTCVGGFAYAEGQSVHYVGTDGLMEQEGRTTPLQAFGWDPTGTYLLVRERIGGCDVWVWDVEGGLMPQLGSGTADYDPWATAWSPDGTRLAAARRGGCGGGIANEAIVLFDASGVTPLDTLDGVAPGGISWRPSTGELAYTTGGEVRLYSWENGTDSTFLALNAASVSWSPDGTRVAFEVSSDDTQWIAVYDDDGEPLFTTPPDEYLATEPQWAPDGSGFLFTGFVPPLDGDLYYATADGSEITRLTDQPGPDSGGTWSDGSDWFLYVAQEPDPPTGIYLGNVDDFEPRRLRMRGAFPAFRPGVRFALEP